MTAPVASALVGILDANMPAPAKVSAEASEAFGAILSAFIAIPEEAAEAAPIAPAAPVTAPVMPVAAPPNMSVPVPQEILPGPGELKSQSPAQELDSDVEGNPSVAKTAPPPAFPKIAFDVDVPPPADVAQEDSDEPDDDNAPFDPSALPALPAKAALAPEVTADVPSSDATSIAAVAESATGDAATQIASPSGAPRPGPAMAASPEMVPPIGLAIDASPETAAPTEPAMVALSDRATASRSSLSAAEITEAAKPSGADAAHQPVERSEKPQEKSDPAASDAIATARLLPERPVPPAPTAQRSKDSPRHAPETRNKTLESIGASGDTTPAPAETARAVTMRPTGEAPVPTAANVPQSNVAFSQSHNALLDAAMLQVSQPVEPSTNTAQPMRLDFAAARPALPDEPTPMDGLALRIATHSANGERNFAIRLDPPELGRVEINLTMNSDGDATAQLRAEKPQTLELLQKDASTLERALKDAGLNLSMGLAFSLKGDGRPGAWRDAQDFGRGRNLQIAGVDAARGTGNFSESATLAARAYGLSTARLDIRV